MGHTLQRLERTFGQNGAGGPRIEFVLIDRYMPEFDVVERHETSVAADVSRTYEAAMTMDLGRSIPVQALLAIRSIPSFLTGKRKPQLSLRLDDLSAAGFVILAEEPNEEFVVGAVGRFWRPTSDIRRIDADDFIDFDTPGMAKATMNLRVDRENGTTVLSTETRVMATDERARRLFSYYWTLIGPFSGFIRHKMLGAIKRSAEIDGADLTPSASP